MDKIFIKKTERELLLKLQQGTKGKKTSRKKKNYNNSNGKQYDYILHTVDPCGLFGQFERSSRH
jgi:hypothetical protein